MCGTNTVDGLRPIMRRIWDIRVGLWVRKACFMSVIVLDLLTHDSDNTHMKVSYRTPRLVPFFPPLPSL
jgi:hypothetical protein